MGDPARTGEFHGPLHAVEVDGEVERVDPPRQRVVRRDEKAAPGVVDRDCRALMARGADELQHAPAAEVERGDLIRPGREAEELLHGLQLSLDDGGRRPIGELRVSLHMVEMPVGVSDDQLVVLARMLDEPGLDDLVHGLAQRVLDGLLAGAGVEEHRPLTAEQQVEKGRLGGEGLALPQHVGMRVVAVHLERWVGVGPTTGGAMDPADIEVPVHRRIRGEVEGVQLSKEITLRMPSWACMRSKPRLISSSEIVWEMRGSTSMSPAR
jgi:hypothetical protein